MIFPSNSEYYYAELRKDRLEEAEQRRTLQKLEVDTSGWTTTQMCRAIYGVGRLLISLGRKLEYFGAPTVISADKMVVFNKCRYEIKRA